MKHYDGPAFLRNKGTNRDKDNFDEKISINNNQNGNLLRDKTDVAFYIRNQKRALNQVTNKDKFNVPFLNNEGVKKTDKPKTNNMASTYMPTDVHNNVVKKRAINESKNSKIKKINSNLQDLNPLNEQSSIKHSGNKNYETNRTNIQTSIFDQYEVNDDSALVGRSYFHENDKKLLDYHFPSLNLLKPPVVSQSNLDDWVQNQIVILNNTLDSFNVDGEVVNYTIGPTVTQFQVKLGLGVRVNKITKLQDDLKLALAAKDIRIEAPIPGTSTVGIEIPNINPRPVMLSEVLQSDKFRKSNSPLTVALGVDLFGNPQITDLRNMPHGLIAGATGSGKSVFINSLLISILYKATPQEVKLVLIDPKAVEMAPYKDIPHLLAPVVTEPKAASATLKWLVKEMENRYHRLAEAGVRNIEQYQEKMKQQELGNQMPYIVVIIDELADLMMVASSEVQDYIARITQKARAAGIHLLVATQRPSVDVVTGVIKNNIPTRIAFMVSSQVDSRTILDCSGAERLLGKGDMLYLGNGKGQPIRLQGTFVDEEIDDITSFVREQQQPNYAFEPKQLSLNEFNEKHRDELWDNVLEFISKEKSISTSKLQRMFSIGYNRAANLIDQLEEDGYISGSNGSKPREVFLTSEKLMQLKKK